MENAKRLWLTSSSGASLAATCLCLLTLQACSPKYPEPDQTKSDTGTTTNGADKKADSKSDEKLASNKTGSTEKSADADKSKTDSSDKMNSTDTKTPADAKADAGSSAASPDPTEDPMALFNELPQVKAASEKVDLRKMPDSDVIVSVKGAPVTIGDYKLELKLREGKASALIGNNPQVQNQLMQEAAARHLDLTDEEKKKLVDTAEKAKAGAGSSIKDYLKENKLTAKDFDDRILKLGLALKTATAIARETLLNEMVDQELLIVAAKDKGFYQKAFNKYIEIKRTPDYQQFLNESGLTAEQAQKQVIERNLIDMYIQVIKDSNATVSDAEVQKFYDANKNKLKHGERFRLSQIVIAAPADAKDQPGIKEQLKAKFPKLSDQDIQAKANEFKGQQKKKAEDILARIQKGEKFEDMANQYTDDPGNLSAKNGGDIGWKEKTSLEPDFVSKVLTLKAGQVYPHVLTTRFGYHLLKLTGQDGAGTVPLSDVKEAIEKQLVQKKQIKAVADFLSNGHKTPGVIKLSPEFQKLVGSTPPKSNLK